MPLSTLVSKLMLLPEISNRLTWDDIRLAAAMSDSLLEPTSNTCRVKEFSLLFY
jgi:hypothetical protein